MNWPEQMDLRSPFASVMLLVLQLSSELLPIASKQTTVGLYISPNAASTVTGRRNVQASGTALVSAAPSLDKKIMIPLVCYSVQPQQIPPSPLYHLRNYG